MRIKILGKCWDLQFAPNLGAKAGYCDGPHIRANDAAYLARRTLEHGDIAVGIRDGAEMQAVLDEQLVDLAIWIERDVPLDPTLTYGPELCHVIMQNRSTLEAFHAKLGALVDFCSRIERSLFSRPGHNAMIR